MSVFIRVIIQYLDFGYTKIYAFIFKSFRWAQLTLLLRDQYETETDTAFPHVRLQHQPNHHLVLLALTHDGKFICFFNAHRVLDGVHFFFSVFLPLGRSPYLRRVLKFSSFISFPFLRLFRFSDDEYLFFFIYNIKNAILYVFKLSTLL